MSIELTAPLTLMLIKFQPEKCQMGHVPPIFHDFHESGIYIYIYPGLSGTRIYRFGLAGAVVLFALHCDPHEGWSLRIVTHVKAG